MQALCPCFWKEPLPRAGVLSPWHFRVHCGHTRNLKTKQHGCCSVTSAARRFHLHISAFLPAAASTAPPPGLTQRAFPGPDLRLVPSVLAWKGLLSRTQVRRRASCEDRGPGCRGFSSFQQQQPLQSPRALVPEPSSVCWAAVQTYTSQAA